MAAPPVPDWYEHSETIVALAFAGLGMLSAALVAVVGWALKRREESLGQRITDGFDVLRESITDVAGRFDRRFDDTWAELKDHRQRIEAVEIKCAGHHGHVRSGHDRRQESEI